MTDLTQALATVYNSGPSSSTLKTSIPGGFFEGKAPEGTTTYPYAIFMATAAPVTSYFGGVGYEEVAVQVQVIGTDSDVVGSAIQVLHGVLRDTILVLSNSQNVNVYPMQAPRPLPLSVGVNEAGNELWTWIATYIYVVRE